MSINSRFSHVIDVSEISRRDLRGAVSSTIYLLDLEEFGFEKELFLQALRPTYVNLPYDFYDIATAIEKEAKKESMALFCKYSEEWQEVWSNAFSNQSDVYSFWGDRIGKTEFKEKIKDFTPYRKRSCFQYIVKKYGGSYQWKIEEKGLPMFKQKVDDLRCRTRIFPCADIKVYRSELILKLVACICQIVSKTLSVTSKAYIVTVHQMLTYGSKYEAKDPAPEGLHQDGVPFVVSAIVVERKNVTGGASKIYYSKNEEHLAFEHLLEPGQGILQSDLHNNLWHKVEPIRLINKSEVGYRSILGIDIEFL